MKATIDLAAFRRLCSLIEGMQESAESGDWESVADMQEDCVRAAADLPALDSLKIAKSENAELISLLRQIQSRLDTLLPLAQEQKFFLAKELSAMQTSQKLNRAYL